MRWTSRILATAVALVALATVFERTARLASAPAETEVNTDAIKALERMEAYLRTLKSFQVRSEISRDEMLDDGQRISFGGTVDMLVQRPNRFRAEVTTDKQQRSYFYNGQSFTLWAQRLDVYATTPAPPTLTELTHQIADKYGLEIPLADLFHWGERKDASAILGATDVGPSQIAGTSCQHYAFRQEGVDWQVWIQQGDSPLPRKLVITTTTDVARPQYTSVMTWNLAPSSDEAAFTFMPPKGTARIQFARVDDRAR